jgi:multicomponent Na+:H+ antiporter subunit D
MLLAMTLAAILCIFIGSYPWTLYAVLPFDAPYNPYDATHVIVQIQMLAFGALAVFWMMRTGRYPTEENAINLDADWIYRRLCPSIVRSLGDALRPLVKMVNRQMDNKADQLLGVLLRWHGPMGTLARTWPTGSMALWVAILLVVLVAVYYL